MSQKPSGDKIANELITYYIPGGVFELNDEMYRSWGSGGGISIPYEHALKYSDALQRLFEVDKGIYSSYTLATFEKEVASWLYPHIVAKTTIDSKAVKCFFNELEAVPMKDHDVFRPIFGIRLTPKPKATTLGPFSIYSSEAHLKPVVRGLKPQQKKVFLEEQTPYLIKVTVRSREYSKAVELADAQFETFENIVRFMLGPRVIYFELGILNYQGLTRKRAIVKNSDGVSSSNQKDGPTMELELNHAYFQDSKKGFDVIWKKLESASNSELSKRILLAADWIGQSYAERVPSSAFIKATIALEILFTPQQGDFVTPSIVSQLSESVALILGKDVESRFQLEADVKRLYKIRSLVAHAGKSDVQAKDLSEIQSLARAIVMKMLTMPSMRKVSNGTEMFQMFKSIKYRCKPL
jgi:hypothetical protein